MAKLWVKITIHPATYFIVVASLLSGLFKNLLAITSIVLIHEFGHILILKLLKREVDSLTIYPFGGLIKVNHHLSSDIFEDLLIASGGILMQVVLGFALLLFYKLNIINGKCFHLFNSYNVTILLFNLIPINPLDGAKMVKLLSELVLPYLKTFYFIFAITLIFILAMLVLNPHLIFDNIVVFAFLIYMTLEEFSRLNFLMNRFYLERALYKYHFPKIQKIVKKESMYKNRENIILGEDEQDYLKKLYFL